MTARDASQRAQGSPEIPSLGGHEDEDAEIEESGARSEPSEEAEPILHATAPTLEPVNDNEPATEEVPAAANDNHPAEPLPATSTQ